LTIELSLHSLNHYIARVGDISPHRPIRGQDDTVAVHPNEWNIMILLP